MTNVLNRRLELATRKIVPAGKKLAGAPKRPPMVAPKKMSLKTGDMVGGFPSAFQGEPSPQAKTGGGHEGKARSAWKEEAKKARMENDMKEMQKVPEMMAGILKKLKVEEGSCKSKEEREEVKKETDAAMEAMRIHMSYMPDWAKESFISTHP